MLPTKGVKIHPASYQDLGASFLSTLVNVINSIIGAGILSIPYIIHGTGLIGSLLLLFSALVLSLFGGYYLVVSSNYTQKDSFGEIAEVLYGKTVRWISIITLIVYQVGVSTAYFVILFEQFLDLLHSWGGISNSWLWSNRWVESEYLNDR